MEELDRIFYIFDQVYNHADIRQEYMDFMDSFQSNAKNLEICQKILSIEESPYVSKVASSNCFFNIIKNFIDYFDFINEAEKIANWIIDFLTKSSVKIEDIIYRNLGAAASIIFVKFYESRYEIIERLVGSFSILKYNPNPIYLKSYVQIHSQILEAFQNSQDTTCALFLKRFIFSFFADAKEILERTEDEQDAMFSLTPEEVKEIVGLTCINLSKCIAFQKDKDTTHRNDDIRSSLSDKGFPLFIFHIYQKFSEPAALDVISSYFRINSSNRVYIDVIDNIFVGLSQIIQNQIGFDEKSILRISIILSNLSARITFHMLNHLENFNNLIDVVAQFSIMCFKELPNQPNVIENTVSFWPNVEKLFQRQVDSAFREYLAPKIFDIYFVYMEFLLNEVLNQENYNIINIESSDNKVSSFISPIQNFLVMNPQIYESIMSIYMMKKKEFEELLSTGSELVINVQKQIAVFIQIFIKLLENQRTFNKGSDNSRICIELFIEIFSIIQMTNDRLSQRILFPEIEMSLSIFISKFPSLFFGNSQTLPEIVNSFYGEISRSLGISNARMCQDIFFRRIITAIQSYYETRYEKVFIVDLLNEMAQKVFPSRECFVELLQANFEESFNFVKNPKYRTLFISSLMTIISNFQDSELYQNLLAHFSGKFAALPNIDAIVMLATDIRGLFLKNSSAFYYHTLFKSFFPDQMKRFAESLSASITSSPTDQDFLVIYLALKMCRSIVSPNVQIDSFSSKRIDFGNNSANGIILFSFSAQLITIFLKYIQDNLGNPEFEKNFEKNGFREFKCCNQILANLISSGYVPFNAFLIYDDHVFADLLAGFIQFLSSLNIDIICQYPKTFLSVIDFFKEMCKSLLRVMCIQLPGEFLKGLMAIIFDYATKGLFIDTNNASVSSIKTIEYILQFLFNEEFTKEAEILVGSITSDELAKVNACLWQHLFSSRFTNDSGLVCEPIKYMIQIDKSAFNAVKFKLLEMAQNLGYQEIKDAAEEFEKNLENALNYKDSSAIRNILISLKKVINQKVSTVSFV